MTSLSVQLKDPTLFPFLKSVDQYASSIYGYNSFQKKLSTISRRLSPLFSVIRLANKNDPKYNEEIKDLFYSTFLGLEGDLPYGTLKVSGYETYTACLEREDSTRRADLLLEIERILPGVVEPEKVFLLKINSTKDADGDVWLNVELMCSQSSEMIYRALEVLLERKVSYGELRFSEDPRAEGDDNPIVCKLREMILTKSGIEETSTHVRRKRLGEIRNDLYEHLDIEALCRDFLSSEENLLILSGEAGTGKTTILKACIVEMWKKINPRRAAKQEMETAKCNGAILGQSTDVEDDEYCRDVSALYIKDVNVLKEATFWSHLTSRSDRYNLIILDDVDIVLNNRVDSDGKKNEFSEVVNQLLSLSNGFIKHDTKIIVTSNLSVANIDPAIMRPGRCFDVLDMPKMSREYARNLWSKMFELEDKTVPSFPFEQEEITQAAFMSEVQKNKRKAPRYFLNGKNYSVRDRA